MAKILFVLPRFHTNMWVATRAMQTAGHHVAIFANMAAKGEDHSLVDPQIMGRHPSRAEVEAAVRHFAPDMIFIRNAWALSRRVARAGRAAGVPMMLYNQQPATEVTSLWRRIALRWKGLPVHRFTPVPGAPPRSKIDPYATFLPLPVARLPINSPVAREPNKLNLLCVAKLGAARKNQPLLIETIEAVGLTDRLHLTLIGTPPKQTEEASRTHGETIEALSDKSWITLVDRVPFQDMAGFYAAADACVLPSFAELRGTAPLEAMAYGAVPIISDECGSAGDLTNGKDGFVVDMHQPAKLAEVLTRLCDDPDLRNRIATAAQDTAESSLSEARFTEGLHKILTRYGVPLS